MAEYHTRKRWQKFQKCWNKVISIMLFELINCNGRWYRRTIIYEQILFFEILTRLIFQPDSNSNLLFVLMLFELVMITVDHCEFIYLFLLLYQSIIKEDKNTWYLFYFFRGIFHFFIFIQISMQRIQEMRKIFENIEYINWKSELFHGNYDILWILCSIIWIYRV